MLTGVVSADKLSKHHKRLGGGLTELWTAIVEHISRLTDSGASAGGVGADAVSASSGSGMNKGMSIDNGSGMMNKMRLSLEDCAE